MICCTLNLCALLQTWSLSKSRALVDRGLDRCTIGETIPAFPQRGCLPLLARPRRFSGAEKLSLSGTPPVRKVPGLRLAVTACQSFFPNRLRYWQPLNKTTSQGARYEVLPGLQCSKRRVSARGRRKKSKAKKVMPQPPPLGRRCIALAKRSDYSSTPMLAPVPHHTCW